MNSIIERELESTIMRDLDRKIVLLSGPRQTGKTFLSKRLFAKADYLNYDSEKDRRILAGQTWDRSAELVIFDELHKMRKWKSWLKGIYDTEGARPRLLVTGSARMDVFRKGGDSLAGRHFRFRLHPFTVREVLRSRAHADWTAESILDRIMTFGPFPEPFLEADLDFAERWRASHLDIILRQDLLDLEKVRDVKTIEVMIGLLRERVGSTVSYSSLARDLQVSVPTVKHWLEILENLYVLFRVTPYSKNIARSLLKDSKFYFYDTGAVLGDPGARLENALACALLRELQFAEDTRGRKSALHYLRDKDGREVDFLALIDGKPALLVEAKLAEQPFSPALFHFLKALPKTKAVQVSKTLSRRQSTPQAQMLDAATFMANLCFTGETASAAPA